MVHCSKYVKAGLDENRLLRKRYLQRQKALMKYDKMTLRICIKNGRAYYYGKKKGKEVYLGSAENETVRGIRELRFCRAMLEVLEKNIKAMEAFLEKYSSPSAAARARARSAHIKRRGAHAARPPARSAASSAGCRWPARCASPSATPSS